MIKGWLNLSKVVVLARKCIKCKKSIAHRGNRAIRCEECQARYRYEYKKKVNSKWEIEHKKYRTYLKSLGTRDLGASRREDFEEEHKLIKKELKELGLL